MTSLGHTLAGVAIGALVVPRDETPTYKWLVFGAFGLLANLPDLPLPGWGHDAYRVSHSLFVSLGLIGFLAAGALASPRARRRLGWRVPVALAAAWLSHLLLDSTYGHGRGVAIFWPVSDAHLTLPVPWFSTVQLHPWNTTRNLHELGVELGVYGAVLLASVGVRLRWRAS